MMPRPDWKRYLDNFGISRDNPIWQHWEQEARLAGFVAADGTVGNGEIKAYVLQLLFDRDRRLWSGADPKVTPTDLWYPGGTALVDIANLEALQIVLANVTSAKASPEATLSIDEEAAAANAAAFAEEW